MGKEMQATQRLKAILRGAFAGPPTPLKDIPKKDGGERSVKRSTKVKSTEDNGKV